MSANVIVCLSVGGGAASERQTRSVRRRDGAREEGEGKGLLEIEWMTVRKAAYQRSPLLCGWYWQG